MPRGGYRPGAGRPPKPGSLQKEWQVNVMLTPRQMAYVDKLAEDSGVSRQDVIRRIVTAAMGRKRSTV